MKEDVKTVRPPGHVGIGRRRSIRVESPSTLSVSVQTAREPVLLKDISIRGLCLAAREPLPLQSVHRVVLTMGRRRLASRATVVHCHQTTDGWVMGLEFKNDATPDQLLAIDQLMEELLAVSTPSF